MSDRGTYNVYRHGKTNLAILYESNSKGAGKGGALPGLTVAQVAAITGANGLMNPYGVIAVNPKRFPHTQFKLAMKLIDYITGPEGQRIIAEFTVQGDPFFYLQRRVACELFC